MNRTNLLIFIDISECVVYVFFAFRALPFYILFLEFLVEWARIKLTGNWRIEERCVQHNFFVTMVCNNITVFRSARVCSRKALFPFIASGKREAAGMRVSDQCRVLMSTFSNYRVSVCVCLCFYWL